MSNTSFHITAKPFGATCNMQCKYCYFLPKKELLNSHRKISDDTLEKFIVEYIETQDSNHIFFTWHGGEPTLMGIDFFKHVVDLQKKHCPPSKIIANDLQTNGILLDDQWCYFLKQNNFLVGISIDGDASDNSYRIDCANKPTYDKVINAINLLKKHNIEFNTLTVINHKNVQDGKKLYKFLRDDIGSKHIQFMPLVELKNHQITAPFFHTETPQVEHYSVKPEEWGHFLLDVFDEWYKEDLGNVFVYLFENFLSTWLGRGATSCLFASDCSKTMAMDSDGSIYACDHFSYPEYKYGNLEDETLINIFNADKRAQFAKLKQRLPKQCISCQWRFACNGECPKKRFTKTADGEANLNYLCVGYKMFFEGVDDRLKFLAKEFSKFPK